ncbi:MAG TPA: hypothetical protein VGE95_12530 [Arthrobacter sp.]
MSEPDWKADLRATVYDWTDRAPAIQEGAMEALLPHIEAAYRRGLEAGRSQAGYSTRRKSKEGPCPTGTAGAAGSTPASTTGEP